MGRGEHVLGKKKEGMPDEVFAFGLPVKEKMRKLMDLLIPLSFFEYGMETGDSSEFECPGIDGEESLCRTGRVLAGQPAVVIQANRYDPLHPQYKGLSRKEKALLLKIHELKGGYVHPPHWTPQREKG